MGGGERAQWAMKRGEGMASKGAVGVGFSPDAPRLLRCHSGRVGSRRDPKTERPLTSGRSVFPSPDNYYSPVPEPDCAEILYALSILSESA